MQPLPARKSSSGQIVGSEFLLACMIFIFVLTLAVVSWQMTTLDIISEEILYDLEDTSNNGIETLLKTPGEPLDWEALDLDEIDNASAIGLANVNQSRVLDEDKLLKFLDVMDDDMEDNPCTTGKNYECNKYFLGVKKYDFYLNVTHLNGTTLKVGKTLPLRDCFTGRMPSDPDYAYMVSKKRNAIYGGEVVSVNFVIWVR